MLYSTIINDFQKGHERVPFEFVNGWLFCLKLYRLLSLLKITYVFDVLPCMMLYKIARLPSENLPIFQITALFSIL